MEILTGRKMRKFGTRLLCSALCLIIGFLSAPVYHAQLYAAEFGGSFVDTLKHHQGEGMRRSIPSGEKELMDSAAESLEFADYAVVREPHAIYGMHKKFNNLLWAYFFYPSEEGGTTDVEIFIVSSSLSAESIKRAQETTFWILSFPSFIKMKLQDPGFDPNSKDDNGWPHLSRAAYSGKRDLAIGLIEKGADVDLAMNKLKELASMFNPKPDSETWVRKMHDSLNRGIAMLNGLKPRQEPIAAASKNLTREDIASIVRAAVEGAAKTKQKEPVKTSKQTDIDNPSFVKATRIFGENDLAVIIGIEAYQSLPKSDYSYQDAKLVKDYMKALGFRERNIELVTEEKATLSGILKTVEVWLKNNAKPKSRVFVYYSGHGAPDPSSGEAYLVPYDGDPNYLSVTGYPLKRLYQNLGNLPASEVIVVIDACFSGAGGRSVLAKGARPLVMMTEKLTLSTNMAVLCATQGAQISTSSPEKGHGVFTYYFLKGLKQGHKDMRGIYKYMKPLVEDDAKAMNVQQSPTLNPAPERLADRFYLRR